MTELPPPGVAIQVRGLTRNFGPVCALDDVSLDIPAGQVTALLGENGAGKSTLLKILAGLQPPSSGSVTVFGKEMTSFDPNTVLTEYSVAIVPQELSLLQDRSVAENVLAGMEPGSKFFPSTRRMRQRTEELLAELDLDIDPDTQVSDLDMATQQLVVVARSVARGCDVLILDEPTAMLTPAEAERLFEMMRKLKDGGTTLIYVSHRMPEVFRLCDQIEVLRDGKHVASHRASDITPDEAVAAMVGRDLGHFESRADKGTKVDRVGPPALELDGVSGPRHSNVSLEVYPGEIVGIAGLPDSGRLELLTNVFGASAGTGGSVNLAGEPYSDRSTGASIKRHLAFLPGERRAKGILPTMSVGDNVGVISLLDYLRLGLIRRKDFDKNSQELSEKMRVKTASLSQPVVNLSGGNQQKALFARWMSITPRVLLLEEPTRGVDVGAKVEIYEELFRLADEGVAVVCSSSDLPELLTVSDRIVVMAQGRVAGVIPAAEATEESIMGLATGATANQSA